jgi:hypothetical protein
MENKLNNESVINKEIKSDLNTFEKLTKNPINCIYSEQLYQDLMNCYVDKSFWFCFHHYNVPITDKIWCREMKKTDSDLNDIKICVQDLLNVIYNSNSRINIYKTVIQHIRREWGTMFNETMREIEEEWNKEFLDFITYKLICSDKELHIKYLKFIDSKDLPKCFDCCYTAPDKKTHDRMRSLILFYEIRQSLQEQWQKIFKEGYYDIDRLLLKNM